MRCAAFVASNRRRRDPAVAIYSLHVKTVSRSAGRSVVAAAAYRAAENIVDDRLGVVWDFTRKYGVLHSEIIAPADAPEWATDRAELWNAAERAEDKSTRPADRDNGPGHHSGAAARAQRRAANRRGARICRGSRRSLRRRGRLRDPRARPAQRRAELPRACADDDAADRARRVWRQDARARQFHDRTARDRSDPAAVGTNRQSRTRTGRARHPHRLPQLCRSGHRPRGDGASGPGRFGHGAQRRRVRSRRPQPGGPGAQCRARADRRATGRRCRPRSSIWRPSASGGTQERELRAAIRTRQPAADPRGADRAALDLQPRRSQPRARQGHPRSAAAGSAHQSDSGIAGGRRAQGDRDGAGVALHDAGGAGR